jgi:hypothetical protein
MSLFVCDNCGCVDNTALGFYWGRNIKEMDGDGRALCSECKEGKWHGQFEKEPWDGKRNVINRTRVSNHRGRDR